MKRFLTAVAIAAANLPGFASAATCADRAHVVKQLEVKFNETLHANSVSRSNYVLEVFTSPGAKTWSILVFLPDRGVTCLAATGKGKRELKLALSRI